MILSSCPCRYCVAPRRHPGCHAICKDYKEWNTLHKQELDRIRKAREEDIACFPQRVCKQKKRRDRYGRNSTD